MTESFGQLWTYSGIITMNEDCIIQSVDRACCSIFGHPLEAMLGQNIKLLIPPPYKEQHDSYVKNYLLTGERHILGQSRLVEGLTAQNQVFPLRLNVNEVVVDNQRVFVGVVDRLEEMHGRIKATEDGTIVSVSPGLERIFGYSHSELIGQNVSILMPEPYRSHHDQYLEDWRKRHRTYQNDLSAREQNPSLPPVSPPEYRVLGQIRNLPGMRKNGDVIPISLSVNLLETKPGEQPWLHAVIETTDAWVVFTVDALGFIQAATESYSKSIAGRTAEALRGTHISSILLTRENSTDFSEGFWQQSGIMRLRHSDGSIIPVDVESWPFVDATGATVHSLMIRRRQQSESELIGHSPSPSNSASSSDSSVSDNFTILSGGYVLGKKIGRGASGAVRLAFHPDSNQTVAVKIYDRTPGKNQSFDNAARIQSEVEALRMLHHPYITKLLNSVITSNRVYLLMDYHRGGELGVFLQQFPHGTVPWSVARRIVTQLVSAVAYCHSRNIIHRDISLQNIMMDTRLDIKLVDFGLCAHIDNATLRSTFCGTPKFAAPEMIIGKKYLGPSVDVWSVGVVFFYILTGLYPFSTVLEIISCQYSTPPTVPSQLANLFAAIFVAEPSNRITIMDILLHPCFDRSILDESLGDIFRHNSSTYVWRDLPPQEDAAADACPFIDTTHQSTESLCPFKPTPSPLESPISSSNLGGCPFLKIQVPRPTSPLFNASQISPSHSLSRVTTPPLLDDQPTTEHPAISFPASPVDNNIKSSSKRETPESPSEQGNPPKRFRS